MRVVDKSISIPVLYACVNETTIIKLNGIIISCFSGWRGPNKRPNGSL